MKKKYPISIVEKLLDKLRGTTSFSKLDVRYGYHQIRVCLADIYKTTFRTHHGTNTLASF